MTQKTQTYMVNNIKQLVDLNGNLTNFNVAFTLSSKNGEEFNMAVVDQTMLDSGEPIEYKKVNGSISGNLKQDNNIYQNFFIVLKAEQPVEVVVELTTNELPKNTNMQQNPPSPQHQLMKQDIHNDQTQTRNQQNPEWTKPTPAEIDPKMDNLRSPNDGWFTWKNILIGVVILVGIGLMVYFLIKDNKKGNETSKSPVEYKSPEKETYSRDFMENRANRMKSFFARRKENPQLQRSPPKNTQLADLTSRMRYMK